MKDHRKKTPGGSITPVFLGILLTGILLAIPAWRVWRMMEQSRFDDLILSAATESGCDPNLIKAVIWRESKFNPQVHGKAGELGLMQVMPNVAEEWCEAKKIAKISSSDLLNPAINVRVGSWYLSRALQQWAQASKPMPLALAQYNAGRGNVLKWVDANSFADEEWFLNRIQFPSTRSYVQEILRQYRFYRQRGEF